MKLLENSVLDSISAALSMDTGDLKIAGRYVCVCVCVLEGGWDKCHMVENDG